MQEHLRESAVVKAKTKNLARDTAEAVVVKIFKRSVMLYAQGPGFKAVRQDSPAAFRVTPDCRARPERRLKAVESCPCHVDSRLDFTKRLNRSRERSPEILE